MVGGATVIFSTAGGGSTIFQSVKNGYGSIPIDTFLVGWTSIYQLFWCELQGYKVLTHPQIGRFIKKWGRFRRLVIGRCLFSPSYHDSWSIISAMVDWLVVWNYWDYFSIQLGMSSSQLTHIFQRGRLKPPSSRSGSSFSWSNPYGIRPSCTSWEWLYAEINRYYQLQDFAGSSTVCHDSKGFQTSSILMMLAFDRFCPWNDN